MVVRAIEPDDRALLVDGLRRLSPQSRRQRFLALRDHFTDDELDYLVDVDHHDHEALVALDPATGALVGVARYVRLEPARAEVAVAVVDAWQGRGVGTLLLTRLARRARRAGIRSFESITLADNDAALRSLRRLGPTRCISMGPHVRLRTRLTRRWTRPMDLRQVRRRRAPRRNRGIDAVPSGTVVVNSTRT